MAKSYLLLIKIVDRLLMYVFKSSFANIGNHVVFHPISSSFSYNHISIGNDVGIGHNANFMASLSSIHIGNHVAIAPNVSIIGGNHRFDIVGKWITNYNVTDKRKSDDEDIYIYIEDDCWIGTNVTILKGVKIGRGCVIGAGSVVNKSIPPYSIVGGVPAKILKSRWDDINKILEHERKLYNEKNRLSINDLKLSFNKTNNI